MTPADCLLVCSRFNHPWKEKLVILNIFSEYNLNPLLPGLKLRMIDKILLKYYQLSRAKYVSPLTTSNVNNLVF